MVARNVKMSQNANKCNGSELIASVRACVGARLSVCV